MWSMAGGCKQYSKQRILSLKLYLRKRVVHNFNYSRVIKKLKRRSDTYFRDVRDGLDRSSDG